MNLLQLRSLCEIVDRKLNISEAAQALHRSQSAVTRQIQELEKELGIEIFHRRRNKIFHITPKGKEVLDVARRMVRDADYLHNLQENVAFVAEGSFTIATTHTQARYTLPPIIRDFASKYPKVRVSLKQGTPPECYEYLGNDQANVAICSGINETSDNFVEIPCYRLTMSVVTPRRHPLIKQKPLTLGTIAQYPIILCDEKYIGRQIVNQAFLGLGLKPGIVLSALDVDISKQYVEMGLGIAILANVAFDPDRDRHLFRIDASHLFSPILISAVFRKDRVLRNFMIDFIRMFSPKLDPIDIERLTKGGPTSQISLRPLNT